MKQVSFWAVLAIAFAFFPCAASAQEDEYELRSTVDAVPQPYIFVAAASETPRPMLVALHPWSHGYNTYPGMSEWRAEAAERDWHYLQPHFRGPNSSPNACGSAKARRDILDTVDEVARRHAVDLNRIYIAGGSGGGHMTLVMAAHAPERWAGASAWGPITDVAAWHAETKAAGAKYYRDIEASCGGAPGVSRKQDVQYRYRSPVFQLAAAKELPIDISAGIHDGRTGGAVPIHHTIDAFNAIALARGDTPVSAEDAAKLSDGGSLDTPQEQDAAYGRTIHLRQRAGQSRVTIFEGGHEFMASAACDWLAQQRRNDE